VLILLCRGYTRKEPYANKFAGISWSPMAENWNGRWVQYTCSIRPEVTCQCHYRTVLGGHRNGQLLPELTVIGV